MDIVSIPKDMSKNYKERLMKVENKTVFQLRIFDKMDSKKFAVIDADKYKIDYGELTVVGLTPTPKMTNMFVEFAIENSCNFGLASYKFYELVGNTVQVPNYKQCVNFIALRVKNTKIEIPFFSDANVEGVKDTVGKRMEQIMSRFKFDSKDTIVIHLYLPLTFPTFDQANLFSKTNKPPNEVEINKIIRQTKFKEMKHFVSSMVSRVRSYHRIFFSMFSELELTYFDELYHRPEINKDNISLLWFFANNIDQSHDWFPMATQKDDPRHDSYHRHMIECFRCFVRSCILLFAFQKMSERELLGKQKTTKRKITKSNKTCVICSGKSDHVYHCNRFSNQLKCMTTCFCGPCWKNYSLNFGEPNLFCFYCRGK